MNESKNIKVLGIETSCDETAVAILDSNKQILSNLVLSQLDDHKAFGGVVPEIAARAHIEHLHTLIQAALEEANLTLEDIDAFAATSGPGLIGGVMVGMISAKAMAAALNKPFLAINHLEGHALTARLTDEVPFPFLLLLVSGGHTQIILTEDIGKYTLWGSTIDDAAGECFDKSAKLMGLPYPGGPEVQKIAALCESPAEAIKKFPLPRPLIEKNKSDLDMLDFSFSGLKTAIRTHMDALNADKKTNKNDIADLAYAFQTAMAEIMVARCDKALKRFKNIYQTEPSLVIAGGVAANSAIREQLENLAKENNTKLIKPPISLCSDNAAMIAWAAIERITQGQSGSPLEFKARPRWPLDQLEAVQ